MRLLRDMFILIKYPDDIDIVAISKTDLDMASLALENPTVTFDATFRNSLLLGKTKATLSWMTTTKMGR